MSLHGRKGFETQSRQDRNLLFHSKFRNGLSLKCIHLENERIPIVAKARNLGIIFDKFMSFDDQIIQLLCKLSLYHLRNLFRILRYLSEKSASMVVHAFITSKIDYCNSLYFGLPKYQVKRLQQLQNTSACFVTKAGTYDHITPLFVELHWLPVSYRIGFKLLLLVYKALNGPVLAICQTLFSTRRQQDRWAQISKNFLYSLWPKTKSYGLLLSLPLNSGTKSI